jgi:hypothetical protein
MLSLPSVPVSVSVPSVPLLPTILSWFDPAKVSPSANWPLAIVRVSSATPSPSVSAWTNVCPPLAK